jgi:hypothetical protein
VGSAMNRRRLSLPVEGQRVGEEAAAQVSKSAAASRVRGGRGQWETERRIGIAGGNSIAAHSMAASNAELICLRPPPPPPPTSHRVVSTLTPFKNVIPKIGCKIKHRHLIMGPNDDGTHVPPPPPPPPRHQNASPSNLHPHPPRRPPPLSRSHMQPNAAAPAGCAVPATIRLPSLDEALMFVTRCTQSPII